MQLLFVFTILSIYISLFYCLFPNFKRNLLRKEFDISDDIKFIKESYINFNNTIKPRIPKFQRNEIENRSLEILNQYLVHYTKIPKSDKTDTFVVNDLMPYQGPIAIGTINKINYIIDGQHRYYAMNLFYNNISNDFNIWYTIKKFNNKDDLKKYFLDINSNKPTNPNHLKSEFLNLKEKLVDYFNDTYSKHISKSMNPKFPNINVENITDYVYTYLRQDDSESFDDLLNKINNLNDNLGEQLKAIDETKYMRATLEPYQGCYLSLLFNKEFNNEKRTKIPKSVRKHLWDDRYNDSYTGKCFCCSRGVTIDDYHAGHIISVKNGGSDNITNLEILCKDCNLSMGSKNLLQFKQKYYSKV